MADGPAAELTRHIEGCPSCCRSLDLLAGDASAVPDSQRPEELPAGQAAPVVTGLFQKHGLADAPSDAPRPAQLAFLDPAVGPDEIGWLAHYRVLKVLGQGGMGMVLLAEDTQLQRPVALKVINPEVGRNLLARERFLREARAMALVRSDHVVTVHQVGQADDVCYLAMELLEGEPLDRWLDRAPTPPLDEALRVAREIALALAAAHARGLVHRDVKPANVWLEAPTRRVKLLDFGLARLQVGDAHLTNPGMIVGTPMYMAPEQARGETLDGRTDLFSLGCVLYLMVTGRPPFEGETSLAVLTAVLTGTPLPPTHYNPALPSPLGDLLSRLLAKRPADRPGSAEVVVAELQAIERVLPVLAATAVSRAVGLAPASPSDLLCSGSQPTPPSAEAPTLILPALLRSRETKAPPETPPSQSRVLEAERRQVTVLACGCHLFESEPYLELDPEEQARVLRAFRRTCEEAVRRLDGTVMQCNEQGLLACFGYPVAHEDAARRAARTGLALLEDMKILGGELHREHERALNPWVTIHTGQAVVEAKEDAVSLVGDARNVAVRLEAVAAPGQVICTEATHRLFQGRFECASLGPQKIKGVAQPIQLFRVERVAVAGGLIGALAPAELSPLTGRDHEISLLKDRWEQAQEGIGQVVLLVGEPGLGKSRLVHTLKEHVLGQTVEGEVDAPVIEWRCSPHYRNTGLHPAIDFFERALGFRPEEPPQDRFDRMLRRLAEHDLARPEAVPLWAALLSLPTPDRFPPPAMSPARQREETFRLMLEWLHTRAARRPVLFIVEDLHWVDASTVEFLGQLLAEFRHDQILILLTFRPEFKPPWAAVDHQTSLALTRLTRRQVGDLMRKKMADGLPEAVIEQVYDRAGGVPLFVEEFTKMVQESAGLEPRGVGGARGPARLGHEIPSTLQDLVMARLDRMEGGRELAQLAAVLGREFSHELLSAVAAVDEPTLRAELAQLAQAEILYPKGRPPRCTYVFKHALLEDALYNSLVKGKRQQFHRRVGDVLEARFPQTAKTQPELLGHHFTEAGMTEKATGYWLEAGQRSRERSAFCEAIGHLTTGLALVDTLEESRTRDDWELQFLTTLAPAYIAARGYAAPEVGPVLVRARDLCQRIGEPRQHFGIMLGVWEWRIVRGDLRVCVDLAADGMALAESLNDPGMRMEALFMPGVTMFYRAQFAGARDCYENALGAYDDRDRTKFWTAYSGHDAGVTHRCYLALALWHLGYPDRALKLAGEACELARTIGHAFSLSHAVDFAAFLYHYCRLGPEVSVMAEEEMTIATEQGFPFWHGLGTLHKGVGLLLQGRREESLPVLLKGFNAFRATGAEVRVPSYLGMLGDAYTQAAQFEDAHKSLDEGLAVAEKNDDRCHEAELYRLKGELLLAESGDETAAEDCFRRAIEIARRQQSKGWELRATMSLARLWQRPDRHDEARGALAAVYGTYTEGFTTPDLVDAKVLLETLA
ncbi:MAG: pknB 32 [Gemmataceae bacterium]|nr:pknB 32 [Gemmataceae bacterium]